jgi:hypothetical protein
MKFPSIPLPVKLIALFVFLLALSVFLLLSAPFIINYISQQFSVSQAEYAEHFGAFIGGYFGSLLALFSVLLLYGTLKSQELALTEQRLANARQNFETKYFELIRMHRDNVLEIGMKGRSGRRIFVEMLRELREALKIIRGVAEQHNAHLSERRLQHIAYYCLFFGVGANSSRMLKISLSEFDVNFIDSVEAELNKEEVKNLVRREKHFAYKPFEGHQSRLGHYYRHLYQMVKYVNEQPSDIVSDKYKYVKTIRAQLSTHEQALLLINSLTPLGEAWWRMGFVVNYGLVKNLPRYFFDSSVEFDPCRPPEFPTGYFEWEKSKSGSMNSGSSAVAGNGSR